MRRLFSLFALVFLLCCSVRAEVIRSFDSVVRVQPDATLDVRETIVMDFEGAERRGIYRKIPIRYNRLGGAYTLHLREISVTDENGRAQPTQITYPGGDVNIRIGDPDVFFTGVKTYVISYSVRRAVNWFNEAEGERPEIYWNATGDEWPFAMQRVTARFFPPPGVQPSNTRVQAFVGPPGSTNEARSQVAGGAVIFQTTNLPPGDGLSFVVQLPAGSLQKPPATQALLWFIADWWPAFFFPLLAATTMVVLWNLHGRDVEGGLPAQVEWSPPKDLSPAEVGTLVDEKCDMADIISTLIDLAARGFLVIEDRTTKTFFNMSDHDYVFTRTNKPAGDGALTGEMLQPHETTFLRGLFGHVNEFGRRVTLSSLKNSFYVHLPTIENSVYNSLTHKHLFTANPKSTRDSYHGIGVVLGIAGIAGLIFASTLGSLSWGLGLLLTGVIVFFSARAMPAKTANGSAKLRECVGFQRFVTLAEKDRLEKLVEDDPTIFGRLLPYAMVLGVADVWATKFADLMTEAPDWYVGAYPGHFNSYYFVNSLGSGMNSMGSTFSSRPQPESTAGSGGSGFSSGGGFSGGGFGGGGGGSW